MKRAPLFVIAGTIAGFAGVLSFHTRPAAPAALPGAASHRAGGAQPGKQASAAPANAPAAPAGGVRTAVGATEQYGYGDLAVKVTASGGVSSLADLEVLRGAHPRVDAAIVGKALYAGRFTLAEALAVARG